MCSVLTLLLANGAARQLRVCPAAPSPGAVRARARSPSASSARTCRRPTAAILSTDGTDFNVFCFAYSSSSSSSANASAASSSIRKIAPSGRTLAGRVKENASIETPCSVLHRSLGVHRRFVASRCSYATCEPRIDVGLVRSGLFEWCASVLRCVRNGESAPFFPPRLQ